MKRMSGTVTLCFAEEDNRQRVIFRVVPLCTREGSLFSDAKEAFPDEGSLRVVPDKHEQSTFKERMRAIGSYCAVVLPADGREHMKVRQNRNYSPKDGECNQFALYSDVIYGFAENACYEVIDQGNNDQAPLTAQVLLRNGKMLYGPVAKEDAKNAKIDQLPVFGNEAFLLHTIDSDIIGKRVICWNPDGVMNWRQRRAEQRKQDKTQPAAPAKPAREPKEKKDAKPAPESKDESKAPERPAPKEKKPAKNDEKPAKEERAVKPTRSEKAPANEQAVSAREDSQPSALPIGTKLDILNTEITFEQQLSELAQPLSESANRLSTSASVMTSAEESSDLPEGETAPTFTGTPLTAAPSKQSIPSGRSVDVHRVVDQQLRGHRDEVMPEQIGSGIYSIVDNPIETLSNYIDYIWSSSELRKSAIAMLCQNEKFCSDLRAQWRSGLCTEAESAAHEQLDEIEAERISLLMQLQQAKADERKYRDAAVASAIQKKRTELERLNADSGRARATRDRLKTEARALCDGNRDQMLKYLSEHLCACNAVSGSDHILTPAVGEACEIGEIVNRVRKHMNSNGFPISDDEASALTIAFAIGGNVILNAGIGEDAEYFARLLLESMGLGNVSAVVRPGETVHVVSVLQSTDGCTPTATVQPFGTAEITADGHRTLYVANATDVNAAAELNGPVFALPVCSDMRRENAADESMTHAVSLKSLQQLVSDAGPLMQEAESWIAKLRETLAADGCVLSEGTVSQMRRFLSAAVNIMNCSFLTMVDFAVAMWVLPSLHGKAPSEALMTLLNGFNRSEKMLRG